MHRVVKQCYIDRLPDTLSCRRTSTCRKQHAFSRLKD